jgi:hypothetical protein
MRNRSRNKFFAATPGAASASVLGPFAHFNQPLPTPELSNDVCPERLQPLSDEDRVVEILGGVLEARADVFPLQIRVVRKNLILCCPGSEHFKNVLDPNTHVANARSPPAFSGLNGDSRLSGCCCHHPIIRPVEVIGKSCVIQ